jgi:Glucodextranase, domain B/FecR protein
MRIKEMKGNRTNLILLIISLSCGVVLAQRGAEPKIITDSNFDIRKTSEQYLGSSDLWPHILKFNNIAALSEIKPGTIIVIPQKQMRDLLAVMEKANKSIQDAILLGAKILANETLERAVELYQQSLRQMNLFEYNEAGKSCESSISYSLEAYEKTKEIREKTIDAIISFKKGTVQKMFPSLLKWQDAELYENLKENDWARTLAFSLADITFYDLSQIKLNENSEAVIQSSKYDVIGKKTTTKVKLEKGDAYARILNSPKKKFDFDIPGIKTTINSKYFWVEKNETNAKLSNYNGDITLQVSDSSVVVQKNEGSVVPKGGFPSKPKSLLFPPKLSNPQNFSRLSAAGSEFSWSLVKNAHNYWIEIASDADFKKIRTSLKGIKNESVDVTGFGDGVYYWHVCSMDSLGLPGPYSEFRTFIVAMDKSRPFLLLESPSTSQITTDKKVVVKGITDPGCRVEINGIEAGVDSAGQFRIEIILTEGINKIRIKSAGKNGQVSEELRTVYFDSDSEIQISDAQLGPLEEHKTMIADEPVISFQLKTRSFSRIEIRPGSAVSYSDSLGRCDIYLKIPGGTEKIALAVTTPAGYRKEVKLEILKAAFSPLLILDPSLEEMTNKSNYIFKGKAAGVKELFINGIKTEIGPDGSFISNQHLKTLNNIFLLKAVGNDGRISTIEKHVLFDNQPPRLISRELKLIDDKNSLYRLEVNAEDETFLKRSASAEIKLGETIKEEILVYDPEKKLYEGFFNYDGKGKPVVNSIVLEDQLANKKIYLIGK